MAIKLADTLAPMADFPAAMAEHVDFADGESLQKKLDDGSLGGTTYIELSQEEYDALSDEEKNNGSEYRTYDTGNIYKNGVLYGGKEPVECTFEEYKQLEADGLVDPDTDYIIVQDQSGILLASGDIGYDNSVSGLEATNVQGAIDKTVEKINEKSEISDSTTDTQTTWSSSKIESEIAQRFPSLSLSNSYALKVTRNSTSPAFIKFMDVYGNIYTLQCGDQGNRFYVLKSAVTGNSDAKTFARETGACYIYSETYAIVVLEVVGDLSYSKVDKSSIPSTAVTVDITV